MSSLVKNTNNIGQQVTSARPTLVERNGSHNDDYCYNQTATLRTQEGDVYGLQCCGSDEMKDLLGYAKEANALQENNIWSSTWHPRGNELEGCVLSVANVSAVSVGFENSLAKSVQNAADASTAANNRDMAIALPAVFVPCALALGWILHKKCCAGDKRESQSSRTRGNNTRTTPNTYRMGFLRRTSQASAQPAPAPTTV